VILLEVIKLFLFDLFIEVKIDWGRVIENEIVLLFFILIFRIRITHDVDVRTTVIDVHNVINYFHILGIFTWISFIILASLPFLNSTL